MAAFVYYYIGNSWNETVFVGFLLSISSTAIVLKTLQDRQEISSVHARNALTILISQDIIEVPMMLITPLMAGESSNIWLSVSSLVIKTLVVL